MAEKKTGRTKPEKLTHLDSILLIARKDITRMIILIIICKYLERILIGENMYIEHFLSRQTHNTLLATNARN